MRTVFSVIAALVILIVSANVFSHHSFSAEFDVSRPVVITGRVISLEWTNPHAWMFIETKDKQGNLQRWAIELLGINILLRSGVRRTSVKPGDILTVTGFGSRDGSNTANASSVKKMDTGEMLWASGRRQK